MINKDSEIFLSVAANPGNFGSTVYNSLFSKFAINAVYIPRVAPPTGEILVEALIALDIRGCSVTMPLKRAVVPLMNELDQNARETGAVNTILNREGKLIGYNTDIVGIIETLKGTSIQSVLVYGSGAVTRSMIVAAKRLGATIIGVVARNAAESDKIAREFRVKSYHSVDEVVMNNLRYDLVVNTTPIGDGDPSNEVYKLLKVGKIAFDVSVSVSDVAWLREARNLGLRTLSGFQMYRHQIHRQFEIYTGRPLAIEDLDLVLKGLS